jgi:uncharacterized protein (TIGR03435 family)
MHPLRIANLALLMSWAVFGQPAFEIASVKPTPSEAREPIGLSTFPGGRIRATNYTLKLFIHDAYQLEMYQILGGPHWVDEDRFDVEAKLPDSSESSKWVPANFKTPPNAEMRQMLQTLLADRFQLKVHMETRPESVYVLTVAKGGPKLKPPDTTKQPFVSFGRTGARDQEAVSNLLIGQNATMAQLVERLATILKRPVSDRTNLPGHFDFKIEYAGVDEQLGAAPPLSGALQEQAGLKLETQPGSVEVLVIDRAEKPSGN